jgi:hypothetical protein
MVEGETLVAERPVFVRVGLLQRRSRMFVSIRASILTVP